MLNRISDNTNIQNNQVKQADVADKTGLFEKSNPYDKADKNLLVDQLDISYDALKMYQKDRDITEFTKLALSDPEDNSHDKLVASQIENGVIQFNENDIIDNLFNNPRFINDLAG